MKRRSSSAIVATALSFALLTNTYAAPPYDVSDYPHLRAASAKWARQASQKVHDGQLDLIFCGWLEVDVADAESRPIGQYLKSRNQMFGDDSEEFEPSGEGEESVVFTMEDHLTDLAWHSATMEQVMRRAGYTRDVYDQPLAQYEDRELALISQTGAGSQTNEEAEEYISESLKELVRQLNERRSALQPRKPELVAIGGCGAGESPVVIRSRPLGGQVWMISEFSFDVCQARGVNAWNRQLCNRWGSVDPEAEVWLAGSYVYQISWPDGHTSTGNKFITPSEERVRVITLGR